MAKVTCRILEIHASHACNLRCQSCSHYSDQRLGTNLSLAQLEEWQAPWVGRIAPRSFTILGGEPTLNPELAAIVRSVRRSWPKTRINLVTNGWFLDQRHDLPDALVETHCRMIVSIHHDGPTYQRKVAQIRQTIASWRTRGRRRMRVQFRNSAAIWRTVFRGSGADMVPWTDGDKRRSWRVCPSRECKQLLGGKIYKCPQIAYLPMLHAKHGLGDQWQKYLAYQPLEPSCSDAELREFFSRRVEDICEMCPAKHRWFALSSPIPNVME